MYAIGVDVGGTNIAVGIVNENNALIASAHTPTRPERGVRAVADDICLCIDNALLLSCLCMEECAGIGVGCPGVCEQDGTVLNAHNLFWENVPLGEMLSKEYGLPVYVRNDADCAALGEAVAGAAKGCKSALVVTLGTGIGGGMIIDGKIYAGHRSLGGEIGHTCICMDGSLCSCGARGCWEAYASASALVRQAEAASETHPESALNKMKPLYGEKIFAAFKSGDATAGEVVARYCRYVGTGLVNAVNVLYPEIVVIGGGISCEGEALLAPVRDYVAEHFFMRGMAPAPFIVSAKLGNEAGIIGAAALCR